MQSHVRLNTVGRIANRLGQPINRVEYVLRTRSHISPSAFAGRVRLYNERAVAMVRYELNKIDALRSKGGHHV
jgi:hypothetical protein